jgi:hypothetical protein
MALGRIPVLSGIESFLKVTTAPAAGLRISGGRETTSYFRAKPKSINTEKTVLAVVFVVCELEAPAVLT